MIIDRLSVFVRWKVWREVKKDSLGKGAGKKGRIEGTTG